MPNKSRKIAYVLGAGFSFASGHTASVGKHRVRMPLQLSLFQELCGFHYKKIVRLDPLAKAIRQYFSPSTYRATRGKGSSRHQDLFGLSIEEVVTFFDEIVTNNKAEKEEAKAAAEELQRLTVELITYLSINGMPGKNPILKKFVRRLVQTDVLISFNWDTLLDRALANQKKCPWHPAWGYGQTVRNEFELETKAPPDIASKYPRLFKLHGSINWVAFKEDGALRRVLKKNWEPGDRPANVVMMPPKMVKPEVWGRSRESASGLTGGNGCVSKDFYPRLWQEAEGQLSKCRRLVFVGYSFPPADFAAGNMLRRAISSRKVTLGEFPEIDIVDPNAADVARRFEQSFKIQVPVENMHLSLQSYLNSARAL